MFRWNFAVGVVAVLLTGCAAPASSAPAGGGPALGISVDHPPLGAYRALVAFAHCMHEHQVLMREPVLWLGHGRLIVYYPPYNSGTDAAYRACDHFRVLAKRQGGPH
jgi:hypothetical protein